VGRTVFWAPLANLRAQSIPREAAVAEIRCRYWEFAGVFEAARPPEPQDGATPPSKE
jgi:hypothetical protein